MHDRSAGVLRLATNVVFSFSLLLAPAAATAQALTVLPVTIQMTPGQRAAALTVINQGDRETSFQLRAFAWSQSEGGDDQLAPTDELLASPPLGTVAPGASQVIRLVLRQLPPGREATYRILLDQIPPPAVPGRIHVALRLSIPIFAAPATRVAPHVLWRVESRGGQASLVAVNDGTSHLKALDIALRTTGGGALPIETNVSPYVLAGTTRRWRILARQLPAAGTTLSLTAKTESGPIDQQVPVNAGP